MSKIFNAANRKVRLLRQPHNSSATSYLPSRKGFLLALLVLDRIGHSKVRMPSQADDKRQAAREVIDILHEISTLLVRVLRTQPEDLSIPVDCLLEYYTDR